jgi:hypothetical protein
MLFDGDGNRASSGKVKNGDAPIRCGSFFPLLLVIRNYRVMRISDLTTPEGSRNYSQQMRKKNDSAKKRGAGNPSTRADSRAYRISHLARRFPWYYVRTA